ncbi:hypothetical protein B0T26DRAFT_634479 [Lasiosphaeria miniovina]|uniref:Uncharacterized protein n=1 Tax=Lasiosphaeria miniovina TaxID=1954250 RepID=A0AA40ECM8_9PEZI|nr:uncharacterized protein B0T26DRAFT_634479 [Lasiosphaeria miniovina]KAK0733402.1 hypothetical protein B0T26DRAFT_634479 [Lasiosphaeria miniovina]
MALTVRHLNGDASFLLTFEPLTLEPSLNGGPSQKPFHILLDPWITGPSTYVHSRISITTHQHPPCISSLLELPEPDLVIISQNMSDHCNQATLKQLPATGTKTIILAEPAAARTIRSWKYFDRGKVRTIPKWEDPRVASRQTVVRMAIPSALPGEPGEVTVAFIPQRRDLSGLHSAVGITYRPPSAVLSSHLRQSRAPSTTLFTPPATPKSRRSMGHLRTASSDRRAAAAAAVVVAPPLPPPPVPSQPPTAVTNFTLPTPPTSPGQESLRVLFSPHGIDYASLQSYVTSHLISEAALPLTALLHCFDSIDNPWWLGGNILLGAPAGAETASRLGARAWVSAHDGDKLVSGIATGFLRTRKRRREDVLAQLRASEALKRATVLARTATPKGGGAATEVIALDTGEEVVVTNEAVWGVDAWGKQAADMGDRPSSSQQQQYQAPLSGAQGLAVVAAARSLPPTLPPLSRDNGQSFAILEEVMARPSVLS